MPYFPEICACLQLLRCAAPCTRAVLYVSSALHLQAPAPAHGEMRLSRVSVLSLAPHPCQTMQAATQISFPGSKSMASTLAPPRTGSATRNRRGESSAANATVLFFSCSLAPLLRLLTRLVPCAPRAPTLSCSPLPRSAKIFRRDQGGVADLEGMKALMRQNRWRTDPVRAGLGAGACLWMCACQGFLPMCVACHSEYASLPAHSLHAALPCACTPAVGGAPHLRRVWAR